MEIKNENKFKRFFKKFGALSLAGVCVLVVALAVTLSVTGGGEEPVSTTAITFESPMTNAVVVKDYADDRLQYNSSLKRWEIHLSVDLTSDDLTVYSVCDGIVTSVENNSLEGYIVTIEHSDGFVSVYSSLSEDVLVAVGDTVTAGQEIGQADNSATNETETGSHLHFTLYKDDVEVDPNNYLDLQNK